MRLTILASLPICVFLSALPYVSSEDVTITGAGDNFNPRVPMSKVVTGSLFISKAAAGSIILDGVERIEGSIECIDGQLQNFSSDTLLSIGKSLKLHGLSKLSVVSFPNLLSLDILDLENVPNLSQLELNRGPNFISEIHITNSGLKTFNAHPPRPGSVIEIANNSALTDITFPFAQEEVGRPWIRIVSPGNNAKIDLGDIIHARFLVLKGFLSSIRGLDNLQNVDKDFVIENKLDFDCSQFSELRYGSFVCSAPNATAASSLTVEGLATLRGKATGTSSTSAASSLNTDKSGSGASSNSSTGMSTGAKAAIAILAAALVAALALLGFFILRYRKATAAKDEDARLQEMPSGGHHEKAELPNEEFLEKPRDKHDTIPISPDDIRGYNHSPDDGRGYIPSPTHELPNSASARQYAEADSSPIFRKEVPPPSVGTAASRGSRSDADQKLDILKSRLEMVRSDKERLSKLRDLDELERELKEEIMTEQRKVYR